MPTCLFCQRPIRGHALQCCGAGNFAHGACYERHAAPDSVAYYRRLKAGQINWFGTAMRYPEPYRLSDEERKRFRKALRLLGQPTAEARKEAPAAFLARYAAHVAARRGTARPAQAAAAPP